MAIRLKIQGNRPTKLKVNTSGNVKFHFEQGTAILPPEYHGDYEVTPSASTAIILETGGLMMVEDVTVRKIPYYETSNITGKTVYIASEV